MACNVMAVVKHLSKVRSCRKNIRKGEISLSVCIRVLQRVGIIIETLSITCSLRNRDEKLLGVVEATGKSTMLFYGVLTDVFVCETIRVTFSDIHIQTTHILNRKQTHTHPLYIMHKYLYLFPFPNSGSVGQKSVWYFFREYTRLF